AAANYNSSAAANYNSSAAANYNSSAAANYNSSAAANYNSSAAANVVSTPFTTYANASIPQTFFNNTNLMYTNSFQDNLNYLQEDIDQEILEAAKLTFQILANILVDVPYNTLIKFIEMIEAKTPFNLSSPLSTVESIIFSQPLQPAQSLTQISSHSHEEDFSIILRSEHGIILLKIQQFLTQHRTNMINANAAILNAQALELNSRKQAELQARIDAELIALAQTTATHNSHPVGSTNNNHQTDILHPLSVPAFSSPARNPFNIARDNVTYASPTNAAIAHMTDVHRYSLFANNSTQVNASDANLAANLANSNSQEEDISHFLNLSAPSTPVRRPSGISRKASEESPSRFFNPNYFTQPGSGSYQSPPRRNKK
ncbi:MAG: hypothetical protein P4M12_01680, partial [Gammaproteobacteria bacterium]|nr:hypothetical protein [Gammaproteobacteria bacterium]